MRLGETLAVMLAVGVVNVACGKGDGSPPEAHAPAVTLVPDRSATMNPFRARGEIFTATSTPVATRQPVLGLGAATPQPREVSSLR